MGPEEVLQEGSNANQEADQTIQQCRGSLWNVDRYHEGFGVITYIGLSQIRCGSTNNAIWTHHKLGLSPTLSTLQFKC